MPPLGIFVIPALLSTIVIVILATAAFCAGLEPNRSILMDGIGGEFLRIIFFHCRAGY